MPPRLGKFVIARPRISERLREAESYRLTTIQGGTGYGKSTVLSLLAQSHIPAVWYQLTPEDSDPLTFISHLISGLDEILGGLSQVPHAQLEEWERNRTPAIGTQVVDALVNETAEKLDTPLFLVLDDAHLLNTSDETCRLLNRFLSHAPQNLHTICATRHPLKLPEIMMWRMYGELLEIDQAELAFTPAEIATLFKDRYSLTLNEKDLTMLHDQIEGWPIALPLIWQNLQNQPSDPKNVQESLAHLAGSENLFAYLTREVVNQQRPEIQQFLKQTAVLSILDVELCNQLREADDSQEILDYLQTYGLFVVPLETGGLRYHHLFRDVLSNLNTPGESNQLNLFAAELMLARMNPEGAILHLLDGGDFERAAQITAQIGRALVTDGRLDTLSGWIDRLPAEMLAQYPMLSVYLGHIDRLHSQFDQSLDHYRQAIDLLRESDDVNSLSYALYSQARVYLDTINPAAAQALLDEAQSLLVNLDKPDEVHDQIHQLILENRLNQGLHPAEESAEKWKQNRPNSGLEAELQARLLLRTGRLREARQMLLQQLREEKNRPVLRPRAHREPLLLLSLTYSLLGEAEEADRASLQAIERGERLHSQYITAVATSRLGLANLIRRDSEGDEIAKGCFEQAIDLSDRLMVPRLKLLSLWGLCQIYGYKGDTEYARQIGTEAVNMARRAGDRWIQAGIELFIGASHVLNGDHENGLGWINQAEESFENSGDMFGETCASMWRCLILDMQKDDNRLFDELYRFLDSVARNRYEFLFSKTSLYAPPDPRVLIPLLLKVKHKGIGAVEAKGKKDEKLMHASVVASKILEGMQLHKIETHPGFKLRVNMFGNFQVWQGQHEIKPGDWKRQKARQLFQLFITQSGNLMEREQIIDTLWPELDEDGGQRDFKIAYTTLTKVLEPNRDRKSPSSYVTRDASRYGLITHADLVVDSFELEHLVHTGDRLYSTQPEAALPYYEKGLKLYSGEYLQEYPYEEWADEGRRRYQSMWLRTAERVGQVRMLQGDWQGVIEIAQQILAQDSCWEPAWRMRIQAEYQMGNRSNALRLYDECEEVLEREMGISPEPETFKLYEKISGGRGMQANITKGKE